MIQDLCIVQSGKYGSFEEDFSGCTGCRSTKIHLGCIGCPISSALATPVELKNTFFKKDPGAIFLFWGDKSMHPTKPPCAADILSRQQLFGQ